MNDETPEHKDAPEVGMLPPMMLVLFMVGGIAHKWR